jgi:hypothetical protein
MIPPFIVIYHHSMDHSQITQAGILKKYQAPHHFVRHLSVIVFTGQDIETDRPTADIL